MINRNIMRHFSYMHLPEHLQEISKPFHDLANKITSGASFDVDETHPALRKLLEAKDAPVRAAILR